MVLFARHRAEFGNCKWIGHKSVTLELKGGRHYSAQVAIAKGMPGNRLTKAEVDDKYCDCASVSLDNTGVKISLAALKELGDMGDIGLLLIDAITRESVMNIDLADFIRQQRTALANTTLPLKDIRVIDMGTVVAAPFTAALLSDFGAEVIKIENPDVPDATRAWGETKDGLQPWWLVVNRNSYP